MGFLKTYTAFEAALMERFEALEQFRALWHGYAIHVSVLERTPASGVDTLQDLVESTQDL